MSSAERVEWRSFEAFEAYVRSLVEGGFPLEDWIGARRSAYRRGKLRPAQIAALEAVPDWTWDPIEDLFSQSLRALRTFVAREGNARVPVGHIEAGVRIGSWVASRRADHEAKKLTPNRVAVLEALPGWTWDTAEERCEECMRALRTFAA